MFIRILITLLLAGSAQANSEWFVVDTSVKGQAPFYLQPNSSLEVSWGYKKTSQPEALVSRQETNLKPGPKDSKLIPSTTAKVLSKKPSIFVLADPIAQEQQVQESQTNVRLSQLPSFKKDKSKLSTSIDAAKTNIQASEVLSIVAPSIQGASILKKSKTGVPTFDFVQKRTKTVKNKAGKSVKKVVRIKVKDIPLLDIGRESSISSANFQVDPLEKMLLQVSSFKPLKAPKTVPMSEIKKLQRMKIAQVKDNSKFDLKELVKAEALVKKIGSAGYVVAQDIQMNLKEIHKMKIEEVQFMQAEILYAKGDQCHAATGIYYRLLKAKNPEYRSIAKLKVGVCAHRMGLFTESVSRLLSVLKENNKEAKAEALHALLSDLPISHQVEIGLSLESFREYDILKEKDQDAFNYVIAKALSSKDRFKGSIPYADKVKVGSKFYTKAQYISSVAEYLLGKKEVAFKRQEQLAAYIEKNDKDDPVGSLVAISKARMNFQRRAYKGAITEFLKIDRSHPMWIEGLQQQAWAQMMIKDEPGAIGNMHSIHTPFFKSVYKPESYVVRGLGYINLCQYADAYKSVKTLEYVYKPKLDKLKKFNELNKKKQFNYYKTAANYLVNPKQKQVNGVSAMVIRDAVRHKDFLNLQDAINKTYDETEQYNFLVKLIEKDRRSFIRLRSKAKKRKNELKQKIASIEQNKKLRKNRVTWSTNLGVENFLIDYYSFRIANYKYSKNGMKKFSKDSKKSLRNRRNSIKMQASFKLKNRFKRMEKNLSKMLQNNELLKYEIFAGAGDNIRYRVTGGKVVGKRMPTTSELKEEAFNWEFDGEFWEDEVGHYRSSLKNICAANTVSR